MWKKVVNFVITVFIIIFVILGSKELLKLIDLWLKNDVLVSEFIEIPKEPKKIIDEDPLNRRVDFKSLQAINPDIIGWIYIPDTKINYPILRGNSDEYYLNKDYNGNYSDFGSIFTFSDVNIDKDSHVCVFGHNMISDQMFGSLGKYKNQEYGKTHNKMYIYTPERSKELSLISSFVCNYDDDIFELNKEQDYNSLDELYNYLESKWLYSNEYSKGSQVFTLATCEGYVGTPWRVTVSFGVSREKFVIE